MAWRTNWPNDRQASNSRAWERQAEVPCTIWPCRSVAASTPCPNPRTMPFPNWSRRHGRDGAPHAGVVKRQLKIGSVMRRHHPHRAAMIESVEVVNVGYIRNVYSIVSIVMTPPRGGPVEGPERNHPIDPNPNPTPTPQWRPPKPMKRNGGWSPEGPTAPVSARPGHQPHRPPE